MSGLFITMEGIDGAGKTTQINLLKNYFEEKGIEICVVREPGGTFISEQIRNIILDKKNTKMNEMTEALLYCASRAQLVNEIILPMLKKGSVVLCDRFLDSSLVYQGVARNLGIDIIKTINNIATSGLMPNITFYLDIEPDVSIKRKEKQKDLDRLESEKQDFYKKVYEGYKLLIEQEKDRIKCIDATLSIDNIHKEIVFEIEKLISY